MTNLDGVVTKYDQGRMTPEEISKLIRGSKSMTINR